MSELPLDNDIDNVDDDFGESVAEDDGWDDMVDATNEIIYNDREPIDQNNNKLDKKDDIEVKPKIDYMKIIMDDEKKGNTMTNCLDAIYDLYNKKEVKEAKEILTELLKVHKFADIISGLDSNSVAILNELNKQSQNISINNSNVININRDQDVFTDPNMAKRLYNFFGTNPLNVQNRINKSNNNNNNNNNNEVKQQFIRLPTQQKHMIVRGKKELPAFRLNHFRIVCNKNNDILAMETLSALQLSYDLSSYKNDNDFIKYGDMIELMSVQLLVNQIQEKMNNYIIPCFGLISGNPEYVKKILKTAYNEKKNDFDKKIETDHMINIQMVNLEELLLNFDHITRPHVSIFSDNLAELRFYLMTIEEKIYWENMKSKLKEFGLLGFAQ